MRYLALAHNERNARGVPVAKVIHNLGREDLLDRDALCASCARFSAFSAVRTRCAPPCRTALTSSPRRSRGPARRRRVVGQLGIGRAFGPSPGRTAGGGVERAFHDGMQTLHEPASKRRRAGRTRCRHRRPRGVSDDQLYRAMDFLLDCSEAGPGVGVLQRREPAQPRGRRALLRHHLDVLRDAYEDPIDDEDDAADGGPPATGAAASTVTPRITGPTCRSRHRPRRHPRGDPRPRLGVARQHQRHVRRLRGQGRPARLAARARDLRSSTPASPSDENLRYLTRAGGHWIAGERMRDGSPDAQARSRARAATRPSATTCASRRSASATATRPSASSSATTPPRPTATSTQPRARRSARLAGRARADRHAALARPRAPRPIAKPTTRAECALRDHPDARALPAPDQDRPAASSTAPKITAEERLDGKFLLSTSDPDLSAEDVALGYKNLLEAERGFRDLKTTLELRPVFHRLEHRIRAHVLLSWLALAADPRRRAPAPARPGGASRSSSAACISSALTGPTTARSPRPPSSPTPNASSSPRLGIPPAAALHRAHSPPEPGASRPARRGHTRTSCTKSPIARAHRRSGAKHTPTSCGSQESLIRLLGERRRRAFWDTRALRPASARARASRRASIRARSRSSLTSPA